MAAYNKCSAEWPELAVVSNMEPEHPFMRSMASHLLENGIYFTGIENQDFLHEVPENLTPYKAVLVEENLFYAIREKKIAGLDRLSAYAEKGFVFTLTDPCIGECKGLSSASLYDYTTSQQLHDVIAHAGLTLFHPKALEIQDRRSDQEILAGFKARLMDYLRESRYWSEFTLHYWKAAIRLIHTGEHEDVRAALIKAIRESVPTMPFPIHHDKLGGVFATAWYYNETGDRAPFDRARGFVDDMIARRPRTNGVLGGGGYTDDPLCLDHTEDGHWVDAGTTMRRAVIWTEAFHHLGPTAGAMSRVSGDRKYLQEGIRFVEYLKEHHQDSDGLLFHTTRSGKPVGGKWSRGQAHALYGMLYMLEEMKPDDPERNMILEFIRSVGMGLKQYQDPTTGLWRNLIDSPVSRPESSGSICFTSVYARCMNEGWLKKEDFHDMVCRAFTGLKRLYWRGGLAANCRGTGTGDAAYYIGRPQGWAVVPWFTAALVEMRKLLSLG